MLSGRKRVNGKWETKINERIKEYCDHPISMVIKFQRRGGMKHEVRVLHHRVESTEQDSKPNSHGEKTIMIIFLILETTYVKIHRQRYQEYTRNTISLTEHCCYNTPQISNKKI